MQFYPVIIALIFNALDLVTGIISAVKSKDIKSAKLRDGLFKKVYFATLSHGWLIHKGTILVFI